MEEFVFFWSDVKSNFTSKCIFEWISLMLFRIPENASQLYPKFNNLTGPSDKDADWSINYGRK